jgi:hypothetical protein
VEIRAPNFQNNRPRREKLRFPSWYSEVVQLLLTIVFAARPTPQRVSERLSPALSATRAFSALDGERAPRVALGSSGLSGAAPLRGARGPRSYYVQLTRENTHHPPRCAHTPYWGRPDRDQEARATTIAPLSNRQSDVLLACLLKSLIRPPQHRNRFLPFRRRPARCRFVCIVAMSKDQGSFAPADYRPQIREVVLRLRLGQL